MSKERRKSRSKPEPIELENADGNIIRLTPTEEKSGPDIIRNGRGGRYRMEILKREDSKKDSDLPQKRD